MALPIAKRDFDIFLSHAHRDRRLVDYLDNWLSNFAGLKVWYDGRELSGGSLLATQLQNAIVRCRGILLVATKEAMSKGWVKAEYNAAMDQRANNESFRVVALRVDAADLDDLMQGLTWIDIPSDISQINAELFAKIMMAFNPGDRLPNPGTSKDVYISCSWHKTDSNSAKAVIKSLIKHGFRVIGDSVSQPSFQDNRIERIIDSCGALVCIIPYRGIVDANINEKPYHYFLKELSIAEELKLPHLVIADHRIKRNDGIDDSHWLRIDTNDSVCPDLIEESIEQLWSEWRFPTKPHYIFCAMDLDDENVKKTSHFRQLIERVTGMQTFVGTDITEVPLNDAILNKISGATLLIADITDDNLNTCIEAGMGRALNVNIALIAKGRTRTPPFMLRSLQLNTYSDDIERIGKIYKIIWPYRRRVINAEIL
ncbi:MAG: hypothetical protein RLZ62_861 [Bacteroidota bacterium]|jgi:hypothetical protein